MASNQDKRIRIETILAEADKLLDQMKDNKRGAHRGVRPTLLTKCVFLRVFEENSGGNGV